MDHSFRYGCFLCWRTCVYCFQIDFLDVWFNLDINISVRIAFLMQLQLFFNKEIEKFNLDRIESSSVYFPAPCSLFSLLRMELMFVSIIEIMLEARFEFNFILFNFIGFFWSFQMWICSLDSHFLVFHSSLIWKVSFCQWRLYSFDLSLQNGGFLSSSSGFLMIVFLIFSYESIRVYQIGAMKFWFRI